MDITQQAHEQIKATESLSGESKKAFDKSEGSIADYRRQIDMIQEGLVLDMQDAYKAMLNEKDPKKRI